MEAAVMLRLLTAQTLFVLGSNQIQIVYDAAVFYYWSLYSKLQLYKPVIVTCLVQMCPKIKKKKDMSSVCVK